jgi:hypothetical protein
MLACDTSIAPHDFLHRPKALDSCAWTGGWGIKRWRAGVVDPETFSGSTTPSARDEEASRRLLDRAATLAVDLIRGPSLV